MYTNASNSLLGLLVMALGFVAIIFALIPLIKPLILIIIGLFLINAGMRLRGSSPMHTVTMWTMSRFFRR